MNKEYLVGSLWDVLTLDIETDIQGLVDWYEIVSRDFGHLRFDFSQKNLLKEEYAVDTKSDYGFENVLRGDIYSWSIDWPVEKEIPIPPTFAANEELFPELQHHVDFKIQEKYKFGYFLQLCQILGDDAFCYSRITEHSTDAEILKHVDSGLGLRMHIPVLSNKGSFFKFGDKLDREYSFEAGKIYIINAKIPHATINNGSKRVHIISDPSIDKLLELISLKAST